MRDYQKMIVWQRSIELVVEVYRVTALFPSDERFGLVSQMRYAAVSISSKNENLARYTMSLFCCKT